MTPKERAEKIRDLIVASFTKPEQYSGQIIIPLAEISAQIAEAEREAKDNQVVELYDFYHSDGTIEKWSKHTEYRLFLVGWTAAREKVAAIAEYHSGPSVLLAERIRSMEP